jgi:tetratricopeptide (TPR) repeat protein
VTGDRTPPRRRELEPSSALAEAVDRCAQAVAGQDSRAIDTTYKAAVELAAKLGDAGARSDLAYEHVAQLFDVGRSETARVRGEEYLLEGVGSRLDVRVLLAEIHLSEGRPAEAAREAAGIRALVREGTASLTPESLARLARVEGLSTFDRGDVRSANTLLDRAEAGFRSAGRPEGVGELEHDRLVIAARMGDDTATAEILAGPRPSRAADQLLYVYVLKRQGRYQEAAEALLAAIELDLAGGGFELANTDSALRELAVLLRLLRRADLVPGVLAALTSITAAIRDRTGSPAPGEEPPTPDPPGGAAVPRFGQRIQAALDLIASGRLAEAARSIADLEVQGERCAQDGALWYLAAAALATAQGMSGTALPWIDAAARVSDPEKVELAKHYLRTALALATADSLVEVRIEALRGLGHLHLASGDEEAAMDHWAQAHPLEEQLAARQPNDLVAARMLWPVPDEHDERVRVAANIVRRDGPTAHAGVVVAMEAARATAILRRILPHEAEAVGELPAPSDLDGARDWVRRICRRLHRGQAAWIMHIAPDEIHHAILHRRRWPRGRRHAIRYHRLPADRGMVETTLNELRQCWTDGKHLEKTVGNGSFDRALDRLADELGVATVVADLPRHVRRIAVTAGGVLADVPFAALPTTRKPGRLGLCFALCDLPCLTAGIPLRRRAARIPRGRSLLVRSFREEPQEVRSCRREMLTAADATPQRLRAELDRHPYVRVRVDSHGRHDTKDPLQSHLQLEPPGEAGRLTASLLASMNLRSCGVLILGACQSGTITRIGRDQRMGLVRAGFQAGAAAVLGANWVAERTAATLLLSRFERHLRRLPWDVALQHARLDLCRARLCSGGDSPVDSRMPADHPARWACWTLFGDPGPRRGTGAVRRARRRVADNLAASFADHYCL